MEWSENLEPASNHPPQSRTEGFSPPRQGFSQGLQQSPTNSNPRPPVFFVSTGVRHVLNYSFQTGEEFALEFMQERASSSRKPSLLPTTSEEPCYADQRTAPISPHGGLKSASDVLTRNAVLETDKKSTRSLWHFALSALSEDAHSPGFGKRYNDSLAPSKLPPTKMKFLCSFGGKFLPRPSDGKLRYVGGYTHVLQLNKDISWREFLRRTRKLYDQFHTIKYQLPGENINFLISVSSDEDLHHMMDECSVLEHVEHKPRIFLFSTEGGDDDDGGVHSNVGKVDADTEWQYVIAVNGLDGSGDALSKRTSASATEMDQLLFDLDEVQMSKSASSLASASAVPSAVDLITLPNTSSKPIQVKNPTGLAAYLKNHDNEEQFEEDGMYLYPGYHHRDIFFNKDSNVLFPSSVPSEFTNPSKHIQGNTNFLKPLRELRTLPRRVDGLHSETRIEDEEVPRKEIRDREDSVSKKNYEAGLSWNFNKDKLPAPTKQPEGSTSDNVQVEPSSAASRVFHTERISRELAESVVRLAKSDDSLGFRQLGLNESNVMTPEPTGAGKSADPLPGGNLNSSDMLSLPAKVPEAVTQIAKSKGFGDAQLNQGEQISLSEESEIVRSPYRRLRSHKSLSKLRSYGSQEDVASQVEKSRDGESSRKSFDSQRKIEKSDQEMGVQTAIGSVELNLSPLGTKSSIRSQESPCSTSSPSTPLGNRAAKLGDKCSQCGSQDQAYSLLKFSLTRSLENEGSSLLVSNRSREVREDVREPNLEREDSEAKRDGEIGSPAMDAISRDIDVSNVQIIKNEDLEDLRELGSGTFGTVYHGKWRGTDVAIKRIKNSCFLYQSSQTDKLILEFWREAGILSKLHHPNVVAFYGVVKDGPGRTLATVTEFMVSGSLKKVLLRKDKYLDRRKRLTLAMDAAIGMEYLHSKNIVHFDLKCDNLLVNLRDPSRPICKVADFGLSKMKQTTMVSGGMRGTLPWMAPELLTINSNKVSEKVDVYSFGIVMWEILTGDEPYGDMHYGAVIGGILNNTLRPTVPSPCDVEWRKLMEQCWAANPGQRPSFTQIAAQLRSMLDAGQA